GRSGISGPCRGVPAGAEVRRHAAELVAVPPDVILAHGASTVGPLLQASRTVPIVFPVVGDPVAAGFGASLAHPGGNATGCMSYEFGLELEIIDRETEAVLAATGNVRSTASAPTGIAGPRQSRSCSGCRSRSSGRTPKN